MEPMKDSPPTVISETFDAYGLSDVGQRRAHNEDCFGIDADHGLIMVADGMGGHHAGEVASRLAIDTTMSFVAKAMTERSGENDCPLDDETIRRGVNSACHAIFERNRAEGYREGQGMGTTLVGLLATPGQRSAVIFNVGDSRAYALAGTRLVQITRDHTLYQDWLDQGGEGVPPRRNIISRALGPWPQTKVDLFRFQWYPGDTVLLCSDGLTGMVDDAKIGAVIGADHDLEKKAGELVAIANGNGGKDNITAVVATRRA